MNNIVTFPGSSERQPEVTKPTAAETSPGEALYGPSRSREAVQRDIDAHIKERKAYGRAAAWAEAARDQMLPECTIENAQADADMAYNTMIEAARHLLICMPTDPRGLVDLLMYLEKNFSALPQEVTHSIAGGGQSLAFDLLRTVRMSLREITKYGKFGKSPYG